MWEYSEKVMEHYRNPRNVGEMENPSAIGETGNISCGDALKLYLKIDNGIIIDAKFQTFGCGSAIAASSVLTEMVKGKTIEEAEKITNKMIADELGGLPAEKLHCSVMGKEALENAIENFTGVKKEEDEDPIICKCFDVRESTIRDAIRENNATTLEEVTQLTKAGGGCKHCLEDIEEILKQVLGKVEEVSKPEKKSLSKIQMIVEVNKLMESFISDELRKDGGDIELVDIEDKKVLVKLKGACQSCPSSTITLKNFVERTLKDHIDEEIEVEQV